MDLIANDTISPAMKGFAIAGTSNGYLYTVVNLLTVPGNLSRPATSVADETKLLLEGLEAILAENGYALTDVAKLNVYLTKDEYRQEFWQAYGEVVGSAAHPSRNTFSTELEGDCHVQFDVVAYKVPDAAA